MNNSMRNEVQARWRGLRIFVIMATLLLSVFLSASGAFAAGNEILVDISSATTDLQRGAALRAGYARESGALRIGNGLKSHT